MADRRNESRAEVDAVEEEVEARNPDPTTKREAYEREAAERGLSEEAQEVGDAVDGEDDAGDADA